MKFIIALLLTLPMVAYSQFKLPKQKDVLELKDKRLIVVLIPGDFPEAAFYNQKVEELMPKYWPYRDDILYMHEEQATLTAQEKPDEYAVLLFGYRFTDFSESYISLKREYDFDDTHYQYCSWLLCYPGEIKSSFFNAKKLDIIHRHKIGIDRLSELSMNFHLRNLQSALEAAEKGLSNKEFSNVETNLAMLEDRTVIVPTEFLSISKDEFQTKYKWQCTFMTHEEMVNKVLTDPSDDLCYMDVVFSATKLTHMLAIIESSEYKVLSMMTGTNLEEKSRNGQSFIYATEGIGPLEASGFRQKLAQKVNH